MYINGVGFGTFDPLSRLGVFALGDDRLTTDGPTPPHPTKINQQLDEFHTDGICVGGLGLLNLEATVRNGGGAAGKVSPKL